MKIFVKNSGDARLVCVFTRKLCFVHLTTDYISSKLTFKVKIVGYDFIYMIDNKTCFSAYLSTVHK